MIGLSMVAKFIMSPVGRVGIVVVAAGIALTLSYYKGIQHAREEVLKASIEAIKKRENINERIESLDDVSLCVRLGGLREECSELLRVGETDSE